MQSQRELAEAIRVWAFWGQLYLPEEAHGPLKKVAEYAERLESGRPRIAVAGMFSSGKTTLVNNLLGEDILPTGLDETTAIPTLVSRGEKRRLLLKRSASEWIEATDEEMEDFLSLTPKRITPFFKRYIKEHVLVRYEHPDAHSEVEFLDLPGLGSAYKGVQEYVSLALEVSDGVIYCVNGKQGMTEEDVKVMKRIGGLRLPAVVVITHSDMIPPSKKKEVEAAIQRVIKTVRGFKSKGFFFTSKKPEPEVSRGLVEAITAHTPDPLRKMRRMMRRTLEALENLRVEKVKEVDGELRKKLTGLKMSKTHLTRYIKESMKNIRAAIEDLQTCVEYPHWVGASINEEKLKRWYARTSDLISLHLPEPTEDTVVFYLLFRAIHERFSGYLFGIFQSLWTVGWRFELQPGYTDLSDAFSEWWKWDKITEIAEEIALPLYNLLYEKTLDESVATYRFLLAWGEELMRELAELGG